MADRLPKSIFIAASVVTMVAVTLAVVTGSTQQVRDIVVPKASAYSLPMYFVQNTGVMDEQVAYYVQGSPSMLYFDESGITIAQSAKAEQPDAEHYGRETIRIDFVGANTVTPEASGERGPHFSYFLGEQENWKSDVPTTNQITYKNLWDGIDLSLDGHNGELKYTFTLAPGANPDQIKFAYQGADLSLQKGDLLIDTQLYDMLDKAPVAYQGDASVKAKYALTQNTTGTEVSFTLGHYNPTQPLTIDPIVNTYAAFFGGSGYQDPRDMVYDATGLYVISRSDTMYDSFPGSTPGYDNAPAGANGEVDYFVFKMTPDGSDVIFATLIGGSAAEVPTTMDVDADGNVYVAGHTFSSDFPTTLGVWDTTYSDNPLDTFDSDGIALKLDPTGTDLLYSTYFGGGAGEIPYSIKADDTGRLYIAGGTASRSSSCLIDCFPVTPGSFDSTYGSDGTDGNTDAFAGILRDDASGFVYMGFIGGIRQDGEDEEESRQNIEFDDAGNAYVSGRTLSTEDQSPKPGNTTGFFPIVGAGAALDHTHNSTAGTTTSNDAFVVKINPAGTAYVWTTYVGGAGDDWAVNTGYLTDTDYVFAGATTSTQTTFPDGDTNLDDIMPTTNGMDQTQNGGQDGFVASIAQDGSAYSFISFWGGAGTDNIERVELDSNDNLLMSGRTTSTQTSFPLLDGPDMVQNGGSYDGYISAADLNDYSTVYSGFVGGSSDDEVFTMAADDTGGVWLGLLSNSTQSTFPNGYGTYSIPGYDQTQNGFYDAGVVHVTEVPAGVAVIESGGSTDIVEGGATDTYNIVLLSQPTFDVTVNIVPDAQQTTDKSFVEFSPITWDVPQTVTVTAVEDGIPECPHTGLITHNVESTDLNYDGIGAASVTTHIDDQPCTEAGIILTESDGSTDISEIGPTSDDYNVVLTSQPTDDVIVSIFPNAQQTTDLSSLTFTSTNWATPQTVQVTAVQDHQLECPHTGLINHLADSNDPAYDAMPVAQVVPNISDQCTIVPGDDPEEQALEVSHYRFPADHTAEAAIIARRDLMADPFTGIPMASIMNAPLLLTDTNFATQELLDELDRVLVNHDAPIYILGREEAITPAVYDQLRVAGFTNLNQRGGDNRRETAAIIADSIVAKQGGVTHVLITEDESLVDALGSGAGAGKIDGSGMVYPILLSVRGSAQIDEHTDAFIAAHSSIQTIDLIGGDSALPLELNQTVTQRYPFVTGVNRIGGGDRFATNALIAEHYFTAPDGMVVANGRREEIPGALSVLSTPATQDQNFFGALLAGTIAADLEQPLLIVTNFSLPDPIRQYISDNAATLESLVVVGSPSQVSQDVINQIISNM